nr:hypothetical protein Iba_chr09bCG1530 [Ipomoea batatas]GMD36565.1 hypothetical protein Iba_chr09eCG1170 [Ipomoea batatas]
MDILSPLVQNAQLRFCAFSMNKVGKSELCNCGMNGCIVLLHLEILFMS